MSRGLGTIIFAFALLVTSLCAQAQKTGKPTQAELQNDTFTFCVVGGLRQTATGDTSFAAFAREMAALSQPPAFLIATGDVTDSGRSEEYAKFKEGAQTVENSGALLYAVPGSHDIRRAPEGKEGFARAFGKLYQAFDYGGAHFMLLDSTVSLEYWGHFDKAEVDWIARDLKKVKPETPIFVFLYHAVGRDTPASRPIDNDYDLTNLLRGHNVIAIFTGSGKQDDAWLTNGVQTLASRGLGQGSYYRVTVTRLLVTVERVTKENPGQPTRLISLPVTSRLKPSLMRADWDDPDVPYLARRRPAATFAPRALSDSPETETAQYRLDDGPFRPMKKDARDIWRDQFSTKGLPIGVHTADVQITTSNKVTYQQELIWELERDNREPTRKWAVTLDGPIQSNPVRDGETLYVSSEDGKVTALDLTKGKQRWSFRSKGAFLASPLLDSGSLYLGDMGGTFTALETATGKPRWKWEAGSPIFATAAIAGNTACVAMSGRIVGLDTANGNVKWSQTAGGPFQSTVATDGSAFYLGGWGNTVYALDAASGTVRWTAKAGRDRAGQLAPALSPAVSSPAVANGRVYVASNDGLLHAYNAADGQEIWHTRAPQGGDPFGYSSPTVAGDSLYMAGIGDHGDVYGLSATDGSLRWSNSTGQTFYDGGPKLSPDGKSLAIMAFRGHVSVLDTATGKRLWGYELGPGNIFSTPEYDGSVVYTVTMANDVQALNGPGVGGASPPRRTAAPTVADTHTPHP